jgi:hypothetical protein
VSVFLVRVTRSGGLWSGAVMLLLADELDRVAGELGRLARRAR